VIYFDSTYVAKVHLFEHGSMEVRALVTAQPDVACCEIGRIELASVLHRKLREGAFDEAHHLNLCNQFEQDLQSNIWHWLSITPAILEQVRMAFRSLPAGVFLRAGDALHLVCARENNFKEIYSNDRHLVAAASHFGLSAINAIPGPTT